MHILSSKQKNKLKKSQNSMEMLMNFGWVLAAALLVILALFSFGGLDTDTHIPDQADLGRGFVVKDIAIKGNNITLLLQNALGKHIDDMEVTVKECNDGQGATSEKTDIPIGDTKKVIIECESGLDIGGKFRSNLDINYYTRSEAGVIPHSSQGSMIATAYKSEPASPPEDPEEEPPDDPEDNKKVITHVNKYYLHQNTVNNQDEIYIVKHYYEDLVSTILKVEDYEINDSWLPEYLSDISQPNPIMGETNSKNEIYVMFSNRRIIKFNDQREELLTTVMDISTDSFGPPYPEGTLVDTLIDSQDNVYVVYSSRFFTDYTFTDYYNYIVVKKYDENMNQLPYSIILNTGVERSFFTSTNLDDNDNLYISIYHDDDDGSKYIGTEKYNNQGNKLRETTYTPAGIHNGLYDTCLDSNNNLWGHYSRYYNESEEIYKPIEWFLMRTNDLGVSTALEKDSEYKISASEQELRQISKLRITNNMDYIFYDVFSTFCYEDTLFVFTVSRSSDYTYEGEGLSTLSVEKFAIVNGILNNIWEKTIYADMEGVYQTKVIQKDSYFDIFKVYDDVDDNRNIEIIKIDFDGNEII